MTSVDMNGRPVPTPANQESFEARAFAALVHEATGKPYLPALKDQVGKVDAIARHLSGVGFFLDLSVTGECLNFGPGSGGLDLDAYFEGPNGQPCGGLVLFVEDGRLQMLEGYTYDGDWPADASLLEFKRVAVVSA